MRALAYADPVDDDTTPQIAKVEYPPAEDDPDPVIAKVEPDDPDVAIAKVEFPPTRPEEPDPVIKSVQYVAKRSPKDVALPAEPKKVVLPRLSTPAERTTWEKRADGTEKGDGYFGVLTRPDGRVSSELSIGVNLDGKDTEIPSLVPTLSRSEVLSLLALDPEKDQTPQSIIDKAVAFARRRKQQGLPYFAQHGEQQGVDLPGVYDTPKPAPRQTFDAYGRPITAPTNAAAQAQATADRAVKWLSTPTDTSKWPTTANRPISEIAMQFADIARDAELEGAQTTLAGAKRVLGGVQRLSQLAAQTGRSVGQAVGIALPPVAPSPRITPDIPATIGAVVPAKVAPTDPRIGPGTIDRSPEATAARQRLQDLPPPSMFDAATDIVGGALQAGTIPLGLLGLDSPIKMALALGLGSGAEHLADVTAEELKIRPDIARFMKTVAGLAGGVAGFEGPDVVRGFGERAATVAGGEARAFAALGLTPHDVAGRTQDEAAQVVTDAFRERAEPLADAVAAGAKGAKLPPAVTQQVGDLYHAYRWFSETSPAMQKAAPRIVQILSDFGLKPTNAVDEAAPVASTAPRIAQQAGLGAEPAGNAPTQTPEGPDVVGQAPVAPETYASPAAPPPVVEPATPQVPFMITRQMAADLRARGIDEQAIGRMTPKEAWDILQTPAPDRVIKPGVPIAVNMPREEPIAPEPETPAQFVDRTTQPVPPANMTRPEAVQWARTQAHVEGKTGDDYDRAVDAYLQKAGFSGRSVVRQAAPQAAEVPAPTASPAVEAPPQAVATKPVAEMTDEERWAEVQARTEAKRTSSAAAKLDTLPVPGRDQLDVPMPVSAAPELRVPSPADVQAHGHIEQVPIADLIATQPRVSRANVERLLRGDTVPEGDPIAVRTPTGLYLVDGHHRAVSEWAKGKTSIPVRVVDESNVPAVQPRPSDVLLSPRSRQAETAQGRTLTPKQEDDVAALHHMDETHASNLDDDEVLARLASLAEVGGAADRAVFDGYLKNAKTADLERHVDLIADTKAQFAAVVPTDTSSPDSDLKAEFGDALASREMDRLSARLQGELTRRRGQQPEFAFGAKRAAPSQRQPAAGAPPLGPEPTPEPEPRTTQQERDFQAKREEIRARRAREFATLKAKLKNTASMGVDPEIGVSMMKIIRTYIEEGILNAQEAWVNFKDDFGDGAGGLKDYFDTAWEMLHEGRIVEEGPDGSVETGDSGTLASAEPGARAEPGGERPLAGGAEGRGPDGLASGGGRDTAGNEPGPGARIGDGRGESPAATAPDVTPAAGAPSPVTTDGPVAANYRITPKDAIGEGGPAQKFKQNVAAITLVKHLLAENRPATAAEQAVLVKFVGWGGLRTQLNAAEADLKSSGLMDWDEFNRAFVSSRNAHYTSPDVIRAIWRALADIGFTRGRVLEPALGVGHFIGLAPANINPTAIAGVELDPLTAKIAQALYPQSKIQATGLQDAQLPNNHFDLAVSNVPFGKGHIADPASKIPGFARDTVHNYYFPKNLQKLRPGGILAFITTHGTLDAPTSRDVRAYIAKSADFLGAIRLPDTAFKANASTEVVTDLIFMKKRAEGQPERHLYPGWLDATYAHATPENPRGVAVSNYFLEHPHRVIGTIGAQGTMYGGGGTELSVKYEGPNFIADLTTALQGLTQDIVEAGQAYSSDPVKREPKLAAEAAPDAITEQMFYVGDDGVVRQRQNGLGVSVAEDKPAYGAIITRYVKTRDTLRTLLATMRDPEASEAAVVKARKPFEAAYDAFVKAHGPLHKAGNARVLEADPWGPAVLATERWTPRSQTATKAEIFRSRTVLPSQRVEQAESPEHALLISLSETGDISWPRIASLLGTDQARAQHLLVQSGRVFQTPSGDYQIAERYLSGRVRDKLAEAHLAARLDDAFKRNVEALQAVQPADLGEARIRVNLGAPWVPVAHVNEFISHLGGRRLEAQYRPVTAEWGVSETSRMTHYLGRSAGDARNWQTDRVDLRTMLDKTLNNQPVIVRDRDGVTETAPTLEAQAKQEAIKDEFQRWAWADKDRAVALARIYNDVHNATVLASYDGSHLELPGMAKHWRDMLKPHQLNAIWRAVLEGNTYLAHTMGAGKTVQLAAIAMEYRRLGLAKKPVIVIPKQTLGDYAKFADYYPQARVLIGTKESTLGPARKQFMARIATGDWDAIVITRDAMVKMPASLRAWEDYLREQIDELRAAASDEDLQQLANATKKKKRGRLSDLAAKIQALEERMKEVQKQIEMRKDQGLTWDDLGVDMLLVDEAHGYRKLPLATQLQQVAGVPTGTGSQRGNDLFIKAREISKTTPGRGLIMSSGTPIVNSIAELYILQKFLQPEALKLAGVDKFDAWAATFGRIITAPEADVTGTKMKMKRRFSKFTNMNGLIQMFRAAMDVKMLEDLDLPTPPVTGGVMQTHTVDAGEELRAFIKRLADRVTALSPMDRKSDNMLKISTDGRKAALDLRLVRIPEGGHKLAAITERVVARYKKWDTKRGTQLIFMELGVPSKEGGFSTYTSLKRMLEDGGIATRHIAFIQEGEKSDAARETVMERMRSGDLRVLIGPRETMGTGVNVQERLVGMTHADPHWLPALIEQANGRGIRQGNAFFMHDSPDYIPGFTMDIDNFVTLNSFDAFMWDAVARKAHAINQALRGNLAMDEIEELGGGAVFNPAEIAAIASNNPIMLERMQLEQSLRQLQIMADAHARATRDRKADLAMKPASIADHEARIAALTALGEALKTPTVVLAGQTVEDPKAANKLVRDLFVTEEGQPQPELAHYTALPGATVRPDAYGHPRVTVPLGTIADQPFFAEVTFNAKLAPEHSFVGLLPRDLSAITIGGATVGPVTRLLDALPHSVQVRLDDQQESLASDKAALAEAQDQVAKPFKDQGKMEATVARLAEIYKELGLGQSDPQALPDEGADDEEPEPSDSQEGPYEDPMLPVEVTQAVADQARAAGHAMQAAKHEIQEMFAPASVGTPASRTANRLRAGIATMVHGMTHATNALLAARKAAERLSVDHEAVLTLADQFEDPDTHGPPPAEWQAAGSVFKKIYTDLQAELNREGVATEWRDHYLAHPLWERHVTSSVEGDLIRRMTGAKRPMGGPKGFLKQRVFPTTREGHDYYLSQGKEHGGIPDDMWNVIDWQIYKISEMRKFLFEKREQTALKQLPVSQGGAKFVGLGQEAPGLVRLENPLGAVYAPPTLTVREAYDAKLMEATEQYLKDLQVQYSRSPTGTRGKWGLHRVYADGSHRILTKFGGPIEVIFHELGHALDHAFDLGKTLRAVPGVKEELARLAALRGEGVKDLTAAFSDYFQKPGEQIANLIHAYIYVPERLAEVAPKAYAALKAEIASRPDVFGGLDDLQQGRSLVVGSRETTQKLAGPMLIGHYYALPEVARLYNNYTSKGLRDRSQIIRAYSWFQGTLVRLKLGLSAFHLFTEAGLAASQEAEMVARRLLRGEPVEALRHALRLPVSPVLTAWEGLQASRIYKNTDPGSVALASVVQKIIAGGQRIEMSPAYTNRAMKGLADNLRRANAAWDKGLVGRAAKEIAGAAIKTIPAALEAASYLILTKYVPYVKLGAYLQRLDAQLDRLPGVPDQESLQALAADASDVTDEAFGQVVWDNVFWPKILKEIFQAALLAPGWSIGEIKLFGGAIREAARALHGTISPASREVVRVKVEGPAPGWKPSPGDEEPPAFHWRLVPKDLFGNRAGLVIGLLALGYTQAAIYQLLHGTGLPASTLDVISPRNGEINPDGTPARRTLPGSAYLKDMYAWRHQPVQTLLNKSAPGPGLIAQTYNNQDYYGDQIVDPDAPWAEQFKQYGDYLAEEVGPISIANWQRGQTTEDQVESAMGFGIPPRWMTMTAAEKKIRDYMGPVHRTVQQAAQAKLKQALREGVRQGGADAMTAMQAAAASGQLTPRQLSTTAKTARLTGFQSGFKTLTLPQSLAVYEVATPAERASVFEVLFGSNTAQGLQYLAGKAGRGIGGAAPNDRVALRARALKDLTLERQ